MVLYDVKMAFSQVHNVVINYKLHLHVFIGTVVFWGFGSSQQFSAPSEIIR